MFCVIQEIERKKPNRYGAYKELEAYSYTIEILGQSKRTVYAYRQSAERFERPIRTAYKISIHESKRANGVVTKRQYPVTTVGYYDLAEFWIGDCVLGGRVEAIAASLDTSTEHLWDLIYAKVNPLEERIKAEHKRTEEYKTHAKHEKILREYARLKQAFSKGYGVDSSEYDYCYDVFGKVMNQAYLDEITRASNQRQSYSSYQKAAGSNYGSSSGSYDYSKLFSSSAAPTYTSEEKARLKRFYKSLSKLYHPDINHDSNANEDMVLLNRLKGEWGI